ncbi:MAG: BON domain-containing protein [Gallionellaceae bacterium]|jgi:osmotically-inducible protein OsmY|nr:BON domain-containing protein [Gallionellaceae bacterium]
MRYSGIVLLSVASCVALQGCFPVVAVSAGAGALMASDRRTSGAYIEDQSIELKAGKQIGDKHPEAHINATSMNRSVLLTGEAPNEAARASIAQIAAGIPNVKGVFNHIAIGGNAGLASRSSDTIITGEVKTRLVRNESVKSTDIKVVTESGIVYLMGLVYRKEADTAAEIASTTSGVRGVVKEFEYLD